MSIKWIKKIDDSIKQHTKEFIHIMDELLDRYQSDEWLVFENVGITKKDYYRMSFTRINFIKALDFYLKDNNLRSNEICH